MDRRLNQIYDDHKNHNITFNQSVVKDIGLMTQDIAIKCCDVKLSCIIYSSSLCNAKILVNFTTDQLNYIKRKRGSISMKFSFQPKNEKNAITFYINSKITEVNEYNQEDNDLYFCLLDFSNRAPDDLINILGSHIVKQLNQHKRAEERFILNKEHTTLAKNRTQENFLFIAGNGKRCILTEISIFSAKVLLVGNVKDISAKLNAMLIIKYKGLEGIGEMIGNIERVEVVSEDEHLLSIVINFDQDKIPPAYKLWISEYLEFVNVKKKI